VSSRVYIVPIPHLQTSRAFSLVEVVIALGLFAFCVVAITGLFGVGLGASRSVANDAVAASLAESIYGAWQMQKDPQSELKLPPLFEEELPPLTDGDSEIYLDDTGTRVETLGEAAVLMTYKSQEVGTDAYRLDLSFKWPAAAAEEATTGIQTRFFSRTFYKPPYEE